MRTRPRSSKTFAVVVALLLCLFLSSTLPFSSSHSLLCVCHAWEWTDMVIGAGDRSRAGRDNTLSSSSLSSSTPSTVSSWLSKTDISNMRVRDIKWRLTRKHGYGADEVARMLDKQELIEALWGEEFKEYKKQSQKLQKQRVIYSIWIALAAIVVVLGWPLWRQVYEVALVHWVIYSDRKYLEIQKCLQYQSITSSIGVLLMIVIDCLQLWLTASVLLSWFVTSKYFFPMPTLVIRPAQLMGDKVANGPMGRYGMNIAPMAVTWTFRFIRARIETLTAQGLAKAFSMHKKEVRANESESERAVRKAARKEAKRVAKEEITARNIKRMQQQVIERKELAEQATQQLFGRQREQPEQQPKQTPLGKDSETKQFPFGEEDDSQSLGGGFEDDDDGDDADLKEELEAKQQFEADLEEVGINDLD